MIVYGLLVVLGTTVLVYARNLRYATTAFRAQWTVFAVLAVALMLSQNMGYFDRILGVPNLSQVLVHLGGVLMAAAELEFIATAQAFGAADGKSRWQARHTFTAVVCALIVVAAVANPDHTEATTIAASFSGTIEAAAGRVLMLIHLGVAGFLTVRLCVRTRAVAADRTLYWCLTLMALGGALVLFYGLSESVITMALWAHVGLGSFVDANMGPIDAALIAAALLAYMTGCFIPPFRDRLESNKDRRTAEHIAPVWTALLGHQQDRSLVARLATTWSREEATAARTYLLRLVLESTEARQRLTASIPPAEFDRARIALRARGVAEDRLDAAVEAAVLQAALGGYRDRHPAGGSRYDHPSKKAQGDEQAAKTRWWSQVGKEWRTSHVIAVAAALATENGETI